MQTDWLLLAAAAVLPSAATWGAARWWYRRLHKALLLRLQQREKAHYVVLQQVMQARKQIEKLQHELSQSRRATSLAAARREKAQQLEAALRPAPAVEPPERGNATTRDGFADTLPM